MLYYLVGMMGSGKTYYGQRLAARLNVDFIDLDQLIEHYEERSINSIFETDGEGYFREIESKYLRELAEEYENAVISTGGGTPCFHDNMVWMRQTGFTIYLKVAPEVLAQRLQSSTQTRPLLKDVASDQMLDKIRSILEKREQYYAQAHETMLVHEIG